ncbi:MAG: glucose 1-dehydrogenase [Dehalococcoidia bacterium]|nr:glucose 1-dehydrogenase [Dehalococcoidia bacterium]
MNYGKKFSLEGKAAVVTGAGRGLGKAIALALADAGADIAAAARTASEIEQTRQEITALGRTAVAITADITKPSDIKSMIEMTVKQFGRIDILVNNAGGAINKNVEELTDDDIQGEIFRNLISVITCCREAGRYMIKQKSGKIINMGSQAGLIAAPTLSVYGSAKAGVAHFSKSLAREWAKYNINVNCIEPGFFYTPATRALDDENFKQTVLRKIPLRRIAQPEELGPLAVYLASEVSSFMTGAVINIDGGQTLG